jgi:hypothetical protein
VKADGDSFKSLVDIVVSENMLKVDNIEQSLLEELQSQGTTVDDYISYPYGILKKIYGYLSFSKLSDIIAKLLRTSMKSALYKRHQNQSLQCLLLVNIAKIT